MGALAAIFALSDFAASDFADEDFVSFELIFASLAFDVALVARGQVGSSRFQPMKNLELNGTDQNQMAMSYSVSALLTRNLQDVFGENDPVRRRAAIDEIFKDAVFYDPKGVHRGRDEVDRIAGVIKAAHPDFRYQPIAEPEERGNGGRLQWVSGRPGAAPAYAGTDFIIARDGLIAAVYLFFDKLP